MLMMMQPSTPLLEGKAESTYGKQQTHLYDMHRHPQPPGQQGAQIIQFLNNPQVP